MYICTQYFLYILYICPLTSGQAHYHYLFIMIFCYHCANIKSYKHTYVNMFVCSTYCSMCFVAYLISMQIIDKKRTNKYICIYVAG